MHDLITIRHVMSLRSVQLVGMILWRGGLLVAGAAALLEVSRRALKFVDIPPQLELGFALALAGLAMVIVSLILERIRDAKGEKELRE